MSSSTRTCWKCGRRIQHKSYIYCSICRQKLNQPRKQNNRYPFDRYQISGDI